MTEAAIAFGRDVVGRRRKMELPRDPLAAGYRERRWPGPELRKALSFVHRYLAEARCLLGLDDDEAPLRRSDARERLGELLRRYPDKLSCDSAWELANELKRELLVLGDVPYVWTQLEYEAERDGKLNKWHRWSDHFPADKLRALIAARNDAHTDRTIHLDAVRMLRKLYELRAEAGLERRVRAAQKCRYINALIPFLLLALAALAASIEIGRGGLWKEIGLAASAGALGAILSGTFRVRDRLVELDDLRSFGPAMRIQPFIGATAGVVALFVVETGTVRVGDTDAAPWAALALFAFVAGFSEPFFLGLVERVAVIPDKQSAKARVTARRVTESATRR